MDIIHEESLFTVQVCECNFSGWQIYGVAQFPKGVIEGGGGRWKIIETKFRARNIYIFQRV